MLTNITPISNYLSVGPLQAAMNCSLVLVTTNGAFHRGPIQGSFPELLIQAFGENHGIEWSEFNWELNLPEGTPIAEFGVTNDGFTRMVSVTQ